MIMKLKNQRPGPKGAVEPVEEIENTLSRRICRSKREGITTGWTKVHNKEVHTSFFSAANGNELGERRQDTVRDEKYTNIFVGRSEAKRPLGRRALIGG
jgi:hypothetical protein